MEPKWLSVKEVAAELRVHERTVRRHVEDFPSVRVGSAWRLRIDVPLLMRARSLKRPAKVSRRKRAARSRERAARRR
jgi:excisionase family DNA binding protein